MVHCLSSLVKCVAGEFTLVVPQNLNLLKGLCHAVNFILFNFANYTPSITMELKVSKELQVNDKIGDPRQTNMSPEHYF